MAVQDKIAETIREIAATHGIAVGRDDPIMILHTINDRLMRESAAAQQVILNDFKAEMEALAYRWGDDAKGKAERTLTAALAASREAMQKSMSAGAEATAEVIRREAATALGRAAALVRESKRVAALNVLAATITACAAGVALWIAWHGLR